MFDCNSAYICDPIQHDGDGSPKSIRISLPKVFRTMNSTPFKMYVEYKTVFQIVYFCIKTSKCFKFKFFWVS